MPKVDVFLTVYDRASYLPIAIRSVLAQTFTEFSLHILDDGGLDEVRKIVAEFSDPRISHHINKPQKGVAGSVFSAISKSQAQYISIINDDDEWLPDFLSTLVACLDAAPTVAVAFCKFWVVDSNGAILDRSTSNGDRQFGRHIVPGGIHSDLKFLVLKYNIVQIAMGAVFRRLALSVEYLRNTESEGAYDYWIALMLGVSSSECFFVTDRLVRYREHVEMETAKLRPEKGENVLAIYRRLSDIESYKSHHALIRQRERHAYFVFWKNKLTFMPKLAMARLFLDQRGMLEFLREPRAALILLLPSSLVLFLSGIKRRLRGF